MADRIVAHGSGMPAAIELRKIAEQAPEVATQVLRIAEQLDTKAADIESRGV